MRSIRKKGRGEVLGGRMEKMNQERDWRRCINNEVGGEELGRRMDEMNQEGGWRR